MENLKKIAIIGQGYVGLPLALTFAMKGCKVYGYDIDDALVNNINNGITYLSEEFNGKTITEILKQELTAGRYEVTTDIAYALREVDSIIVTVGIPVTLGKTKLNNLLDAVTQVGKNLKRNDLVLIRSTVIPGTTEEVIIPILETESRMKAGKDFHIAYASERIAEGKAFYEFISIPTVVAGINEESAMRAKELLSLICGPDKIVTASSIKVVETSKVFENVQRDVNIAMVQEFARFTEALGIDIFEVIRVANTHPRVNLLMPGPGVGGYCIPNAYYYLESKARQLNVSLELLKLARMKNDEIPKIMVNILNSMLKEEGKSIRGSKIGILGLAMKDYSSDDRMSPAVKIVEILEEEGAEVQAFDSLVPTKYKFKVADIASVLKGKDAIMVLAKHKEYENFDETYINLIDSGTVVLDTRNLFEGKEDKLRTLGIKLRKI